MGSSANIFAHCFSLAIPVGSRNCCEIIQQEMNSTRDQPINTSKSVIPVTETLAEDILERACFAQQKVFPIHDSNCVFG